MPASSASTHEHVSKDGTYEMQRCSNCGDRYGMHYCLTHDQEELLITVDGAGGAFSFDGETWVNVDHPDDRRAEIPKLPECTRRLMVSDG